MSLSEGLLKRFEVHSHSEYSNLRLLDSINKAEDLIEMAYKKGLSGIALTDHECLSGHVKFLKAEENLKKKGTISEDFKCALGNEIYLVESRQREKIKKYYHFILIAKNKKGHEALKKLSSIAWYNSFSSRGQYRVPTLYGELAEVVAQYPNSLIASSACLGSEFASLVLDLIEAKKRGFEEEFASVEKEILDFLGFCQGCFGEDFYIEIAPSPQKEQKDYNKAAVEIADRLGIKVVIGTDAHYLDKNDRAVHKAYLNSKEGEREVDSFYSATYLMDSDEVFKLMPYFSREKIIEIFNNSLEIMDKIERYTLKEIQHIPLEPVKKYPKKANAFKEYPNISWYLNAEHEQDRAWINNVLESAEEKNLLNEEYLSRIEKEADIQRVISEKLQQPMSGYHNTMAYWIDKIWECQSILAPGRGSATGWVTNFLLGITQISPLKWDLREWRYLNKERAEIGDIDIDIAPSKRPLVFKKIREEKGETGMLQVCAFGTEGTRSAILSACRGYRSKKYPEGIDSDVAQSLTSMIPSERGFLWSISDVVEGNEEKKRKPNKAFLTEMDKYPGLLDIIIRIEGLINKRTTHASGVIFYNDEVYKTNAIMRSPDGSLITQFNLEDSEYLGDTKFDFLVTKVLDKITQCIELLQKDGFVEKDLTLREIYNKYLHPDVLNLEDDRIWTALAEDTVLDVFQFSEESGVQVAKAVRPTNPLELTACNALMRLMAEAGRERPLDRYVRLKENLNLWYEEMDSWGLSAEEQKTLETYYKQDYGTPPYQESIMSILIDKDISGFTVSEANDARKIIGKKQMDRIPELREKFFKRTNNKNLAEYVWETAILPQMGYAFSVNHSLPYSFVGIQTLYLATNYPDIYWNCACLIVNSGKVEEELKIDEEEKRYRLLSNFKIVEEIDEIDEEDLEDEDDVEEEDSPKKDIKKRKTKKANSADYGRIATAIGEMTERGIKIVLPDINKSGVSFVPELETNSIRYGLKGISRIGDALVLEIIKNRPYSSIKDLTDKVKINKPSVVSLIKSGAFDFLAEREKVMEEYIASISDQKKTVNLRNVLMLIRLDLFPESLDFEKRVFMFNRHIKKFKDKEFYNLDDYSLKFYEAHFDIDNIFYGDKNQINQAVWDKIYQKNMDKVRAYLKKNHDSVLESLNKRLREDMWNKYAKGTISKWEMDSVSFYHHEHELAPVQDSLYSFVDFFQLNEEPETDRQFQTKDGKTITLYKLYRIAGTVIDKEKDKNSVTLLTKTGVVNVKVWRAQFTKYDKRLSRKRPDGTKQVIENSWFTRGNKIAIVGIRRGDSFIPKIYKNSIWSEPFNLITEISDEGYLKFKKEREIED